jgi:hypothetical protein
MNVRRDSRPSDSRLAGRFVERITRVVYGADTHDVTTPDGCWDLVVMKLRGRVAVLQTGVITRPVALDYRAGDEYLCISFRPGVFMPRLPGVEMVDRGRLRPLSSTRAFHLDSEVLEIPTFANAESMVERLVRREIITRDEIVEGVVDGRPRAISPRSVQRHFLQALGLSPKQLAQIQRARQAVTLLRQGRPMVDVALEIGYADQPHLTRSLKRIMGQTPGQIVSTPPAP